MNEKQHKRDWVPASFQIVLDLERDPEFSGFMVYAPDGNGDSVMCGHFPDVNRALELARAFRSCSDWAVIVVGQRDD